MQINSTGFVKATLDNYLEYMTADIQADGTFGEDYTIKKEGVVDAILSTVANAMISLEDKIAYALKQRNPFVSEGQYQDDIYSEIGLTRNYATQTVVTRTIEGTVGVQIGVNELVFKTPQDDQFYLNSAVTIGENGKVEGSFTAYERGAIQCDEQSSLTIVSAPEGVVGVYYSEGNVTTIGDDYEDDSQFRLRWLETKSVKSGNTEGGMYAALLPLCDNSTRNLVITQNRTNSTVNSIPAHSMHIVLNSAEDDNTIANAIFDNLMDGVGLYGDVSVTVKDLSGEDVTIYFSRTDTIRIYFNVEVVLKDGYLLAQVRDSIKSAIVDNFDYAMSERVIANDFYQYINAIDGVDYVTTLEISDKKYFGWKSSNNAVVYTLNSSPIVGDDVYSTIGGTTTGTVGSYSEDVITINGSSVEYTRTESEDGFDGDDWVQTLSMAYNEKGTVQASDITVDEG